MYKKNLLPRRHKGTKYCFNFSSSRPFGNQKGGALCLCVFVAGFCVFFLTSCSSLDSSSKKNEVSQIRSSVSQDIINVNHEIDSLKGRLDELQYKIDKISQAQTQQSSEINTTLKEWRKETQNDVEKMILDLKIKQAQDLKGLEEKDKIIIEEVSKENTELRKQIESIKKLTVYTTEEGYYVVNEGDTLSKIAQTFGVSLKILMEANNITNPNSIRKGQKLIIPQKK